MLDYKLIKTKNFSTFFINLRINALKTYKNVYKISQCGKVNTTVDVKTTC